MKRQTIILFTGLLFLIGQKSAAQTECDTTEYHKLINNSFQCRGTFFQLTDTIAGTIIRHEKQEVGCGIIATASLTIIKTESDTIRVIDLCNQDDYKSGQIVKIIPGKEPSFQVWIPCYYDIVKTTAHKYFTRSNDFDAIILKTTWGHLTGQNNGGFKTDSTGCPQWLVESCKKENKKYKNHTIVRTTNNDSLLKKYIYNYRCCGGEQYIVTLQQKFKLTMINDTTFQFKIKDKGQLRYEDEPDWTTFLWCPIGKPNGTVILIDGDGKKRREYNYKNEMLNGKIILWNANGTVAQEWTFQNDKEVK